MCQRFGRRACALRGLIATSLLSVCARAEGAPPAAQPFAYSYAPSAYAAVYSQPAGAGVPPDRSRVELTPGEHRFSLLVSVVHPLAFSIYDASGEFRLGKRAGLGVVAGLGSASLRQFYKSLRDGRAR